MPAVTTAAGLPGARRRPDLGVVGRVGGGRRRLRAAALAAPAAPAPARPARRRSACSSRRWRWPTGSLLALAAGDAGVGRVHHRAADGPVAGAGDRHAGRHGDGGVRVDGHGHHAGAGGRAVGGGLGRGVGRPLGGVPGERAGGRGAGGRAVAAPRHPGPAPSPARVSASLRARCSESGVRCIQRTQRRFRYIRPRTVSRAGTPAARAPTPPPPATARGRRRRTPARRPPAPSPRRPSTRSASRTCSSRSSRCARYCRAAAGASGSSGPCPGSTTVPSGSSREPAQRRQVRAQRAVRMRDHGGAPAEDRVAGEHGRPAGVRPVEQERQRVRRVARRRHHPQLAARRGHHVAVAERLGPEDQRRVQRPHRRPGQLGEAARARGVVVVAVGEQHQRDRPVRGHPLLVGGVVVAGVDDHALPRAGRPQHPGVGALQRHRRRVVLQHHRRQRRDRPQPSVGRVHLRPGRGRTAARGAPGTVTTARPPPAPAAGGRSAHRPGSARRPAPPPCPGTPRSPPACAAVGGSSRRSPRRAPLQRVGGTPPGRLDGLGRPRVRLLARGHPRDEERRVVAARLRLGRHPARPRGEQVGAQRRARPRRGPRAASGGGRPGRRGASPSTAPGPASSTPHSSNVSRTAVVTSAPPRRGRAAEVPPPPRRVGPAPERRVGRSPRRPRRRGTRCSRPRTPSRPPAAGGRPAARPSAGASRSSTHGGRGPGGGRGGGHARTLSGRGGPARVPGAVPAATGVGRRIPSRRYIASGPWPRVRWTPCVLTFVLRAPVRARAALPRGELGLQLREQVALGAVQQRRRHGIVPGPGGCGHVARPPLVRRGEGCDRTAVPPAAAAVRPGRPVRPSGARPSGPGAPPNSGTSDFPSPKSGSSAGDARGGAAPAGRAGSARRPACWGTARRGGCGPESDGAPARRLSSAGTTAAGRGRRHPSPWATRTARRRPAARAARRPAAGVSRPVGSPAGPERSVRSARRGRSAAGSAPRAGRTRRRAGPTPVAACAASPTRRCASPPPTRRARERPGAGSRGTPVRVRRGRRSGRPAARSVSACGTPRSGPGRARLGPGRLQERGQEGDLQGPVERVGVRRGVERIRPVADVGARAAAGGRRLRPPAPPGGRGGFRSLFRAGRAGATPSSDGTDSGRRSAGGPPGRTTAGRRRRRGRRPRAAPAGGSSSAPPRRRAAPCGRSAAPRRGRRAAAGPP